MKRYNTYVFDLDGKEVKNRKFLSYENAVNYLNSYKDNIVAIMRKNEILYVAYHDKHIDRRGKRNYIQSHLSY